MTLRDRKKERTRQQLAEAAIALFEERGFDEVTVGEIAEQAWVSERTFFRYFASKEDVLWLGSETQLAALHAAIVARPEQERPILAVRNALLDLAAALAVDPEFAITRGRIVADSSTLVARDLVEQSKWEAEVAAAVAERSAPVAADDVGPAMVAVAASGALRVSFLRWSAAGGKQDIRALVTESFEALQAAIC